MEFAVFFQITFFILVTQVKNSSSQENSTAEIPKKNAQIQLLNRNQDLENKIKDLEKKVEECGDELLSYEEGIDRQRAATFAQRDELKNCRKSLEGEQKKTKQCEVEKNATEPAISELRMNLTAKERDIEECENELRTTDDSIIKLNRSNSDKDVELEKCRKDLQEEPNKTKQCEDEKRQLDPTLNELRANLTAKERVYEVCERKRAPLRTENAQLLNELNQERNKNIVYEKTIIVKKEEIEQLKRGTKVVKKVDQVETKQECSVIPNLLDVLNVAKTVKQGFSQMLRSVINKFKINE